MKYDTDEIFGKLAGSEQTNMSKLLAAYASQDSAAAFRFADLSGIDLASDFPTIVVQNCDQAPFLAFAVERASSNQKEAKKWAPLLAEAGLRSRYVADQLAAKPVREIFNNFLKLWNIPQWHVAFLTPDNLYTQIIAMAIGGNNDKESLPLLCILKNVPSPSSYRIPPKFLVIIPALCLLTFAGFTIVYFFTQSLPVTSVDPSTAPLQFKLPLWLVASSYLSLPFQRYVSARRTIYHKLMFPNSEVIETPSASSKLKSFFINRINETIWVNFDKFLVGQKLRNASSEMTALRSRSIQ